jgi:predicted permease
VDRVHEGAPEAGAVSYPDLLDWRRSTPSLDGIAGHTEYSATYVGEGVAEIWDGLAVTPNLLQVLGLSPAVGVGVPDGEVTPGDKVILLGHHLWERRFGADPALIGRSLQLDGESWQVVGILPPGFEYPRQGVDILVPLPDNWTLANRGAGMLTAVARLAPGVSLEAARTEVSSVVRTIDEEYTGGREGVVVRRYSDVVVAPVRRVLLIFMAAVVLLLLAACANVAGLALGRTEMRAHELAVRTSLGAGRARLARLLLVESLMVALAGGGVGLLLSVFGVRALVAGAPVDLPRRSAVALDPGVLLFAVSATVAAGVLFGFLPALKGAAGARMGLLRSGRRSTVEGRRVQELLAAAQIAVGVVLISGAGHLLRSFATLTSVDPGFRTEGALVVELGLEDARYRSLDATLSFHQLLMDQVRGLPGVTDVGLTTHLPFSPARISVAVARAGESFSPNSAPEVALEMYDGDYFRAMGIDLVRGTIPSKALGTGERQVVVSETTARELWPGEDPLGHGFSFDVEEGQPSPEETLFTVAGVVTDVRKGSLEEPPAALAYYYLPDFRQHFGFVSGRYFFLVVATDGDPTTLIEPTRRVLAALDPGLPVRSVTTLDGLVRASTVPARFRTFVLSVFSILAIAVAFVGVFSVTAFGVSRKRREIGIRMALGASAPRERWLVLRRVGLITGCGSAVGLVGALLTGPVLSAVLFQIPPRDPRTLLTVLVLTLGGCLIAAYPPALRASRVDPMRVLREE